MKVRVRRGRRSVRRGRKGVRRNYRLKRSVPGIVHRVKRFGQEVIIRNTNVGGSWVPTMTTNDAFFMSSPTQSTALAGNYDYTLSTLFKLSSVNQPSDLTNLFDRYKISGVCLKIQYLQNVGSPQGVPNVGAVYSNLPTIVYAFDGDDANVNTADVIQQKGYAKTRVLNANRPLSVYIRPRVTKEIYNSTISTGYSSEKACWLDANSSSIPHFGLKMSIRDWVSAENTNALRITPIYYLQFKDTQ